LNVAVIHKLVLLHDVLGSGVVDAQHLRRLFYGDALSLNNVD
jgi:hypothetical protein